MHPLFCAQEQTEEALTALLTVYQTVAQPADTSSKVMQYVHLSGDIYLVMLRGLVGDPLLVASPHL
jgi:hypothetical protein